MRLISFRTVKGKAPKDSSQAVKEIYRREREANIFATELLMPEKIVREKHQLLFIPILEDLSSEFNVSKQAMKYRLNELGLNYV